jgi:hypothetical protein
VFDGRPPLEVDIQGAHDVSRSNNVRSVFVSSIGIERARDRGGLLTC